MFKKMTEVDKSENGSGGLPKMMAVQQVKVEEDLPMIIDDEKDKCHIRHLGEKHFDNMDPQQVQDTLDNNLVS